MSEKTIFNQVILRGNATRDAEVKTTRSNKTMTIFTLAHNKKKDDGDPMFIRCVYFDEPGFEIKKGDPLNVVGRLQNNSYTNKEGVKVTSFEIIADEVELVVFKKKTEKPEMSPEQMAKSKKIGKRRG